VTHVEAFMNAEAEAQDEHDRENDPVGYALRTGDIDHLSQADLRKYDELRADAEADELEEFRAVERMREKRDRLVDLSYTYDDVRVAFESGFTSCQEHMDADDAWDEHRAFLSMVKWTEAERLIFELAAHKRDSNDVLIDGTKLFERIQACARDLRGEST
jgi:hypothetical protein